MGRGADAERVDSVVVANGALVTDTDHRAWNGFRCFEDPPPLLRSTSETRYQVFPVLQLCPAPLLLCLEILFDKHIF